jgi:putative ABC transport system ATP-binding protein
MDSAGKEQRGEGPLITLETVTKMYGTGLAAMKALQGIDLCIRSGEFLAVMGPSGSGKSTCMNILGCLDVPTTGTYRFKGVDVGRLSRDQRALLRRHYVGFIFQGYNLLNRTSALENVELPMLYTRQRLAGHSQRERAVQALETVGLADRADHKPNQLSGGQQQRVAIARALANQPSLLLADEPTGNLDSRTSVDIMGVFQKLNAQGMTIVMVTHELDIAQYTRRMVVMRDGKVVGDTPVARRLDAENELRRLQAEQKAVHLGD